MIDSSLILQSITFYLEALGDFSKLNSKNRQLRSLQKDFHNNTKIASNNNDSTFFDLLDKINEARTTVAQLKESIRDNLGKAYLCLSKVIQNMETQENEKLSDLLFSQLTATYNFIHLVKDSNISFKNIARKVEDDVDKVELLKGKSGNNSRILEILQKIHDDIK